MPTARDENGNARTSTDGRRLYQCDNCGTLGLWDDNWAWFGSYRQHEDCGLKGVKPVITICSDDCRIKMVATGRLPHEGLTNEGKVIEEYSPPIKQRGQR